MQTKREKKELIDADKRQMEKKEKRKEKIVGDIVRSTMVACDETTPVIEVAQIMVLHRIRYCFVVNNHDELIGIIAARSLQKAAGSNMGKAVAGEVMLPKIYTARMNTTVTQAAKEMYKNRVQHLVVVTERPNKAAIGIIGATDILRQIDNK